MAKHKSPPRLKQGAKVRTFKVGVTWYSESEWSLVKASATDPERFEETYAEWVAMAEESTKRMLASGIVTERVFVFASDLLAWCTAHGRPNNAAARAQFVAQLLPHSNESAA